MNKIIAPLMFASLLLTANAAVAGDAAAGKSKSAVCVGCHGSNGISGNTMWPDLAGQKEGYLAKQIKSFRDGIRNDPMMSSMVKNLSDTDVDDLAAYYSGLK